jgi:D-alanine transaminase
MQVYLDGRFLPHGEARISVDDRGFVFADGVYEVIRVYDGHAFLADAHVRRLRAGLAAIRIPHDAAGDVLSAADRLLDANDLRQGDATIYIQITRGAAPRRHSFPEAGVPPTVYVAVRPFRQHPTSCWDDGIATITLPDTRWSRCDIKSIALLPNVLANQMAREAGAFEALLVRDGILIEGSHSNLAGVLDDAVVTYPECNYILPGITRRLVLDMARELGLTVREGAIPLERLPDAQELFLTGTTTEVMPITRVDGHLVGDGRPGPVARRLQLAYHARVDAARSAPAQPHTVLA